MKVLGYLLIACLACAALQAAAAALTLLFGVAVILSVCTRPRETFGLMAFLLVSDLAYRSPSIILLILGAAPLIAIARANAG
jgi:hypothetical protein